MTGVWYRLDYRMTGIPVMLEASRLDSCERTRGGIQGQSGLTHYSRRDRRSGAGHVFGREGLRIAGEQGVSELSKIMSISFDKVAKGVTYSRQELAELWGYASFHAIARGVVTPRDDNKIVLFVTEEKQSSAEQYVDCLSDGTLEWEGPTDHFAEDRMLNAASSGDEIHLFHRMRHHADFTYCGRLVVVSGVRRTDQPSHFIFKVD